jgi:hypothetical protein
MLSKDLIELKGKFVACAHLFDVVFSQGQGSNQEPNVVTRKAMLANYNKTF